MPDRKDLEYRYAYQGQEKDPETGMEAFELRLWDGRIGRWLNPDPKGQYASPYLGMGNNPISRTDPDGGADGDGEWVKATDKGDDINVDFYHYDNIYDFDEGLIQLTVIRDHEGNSNVMTNGRRALRGEIRGE